MANYVAHVVLNSPVEPKLGVLPKEMSLMDRIKVDLEQVKKLARALDQDVGLSQEEGVAIIDKWMESDDNDEGLKVFQLFNGRKCRNIWI